jgi:hypothetical protein
VPRLRPRPFSFSSSGRPAAMTARSAFVRVMVAPPVRSLMRSASSSKRRSVSSSSRMGIGLPAVIVVYQRYTLSRGDVNPRLAHGRKQAKANRSQSTSERRGIAGPLGGPSGPAARSWAAAPATAVMSEVVAQGSGPAARSWAGAPQKSVAGIPGIEVRAAPRSGINSHQNVSRSSSKTPFRQGRSVRGDGLNRARHRRNHCRKIRH